LAELSDSELIERVVRRDEQAFLMLYDRYASRVYGLVFRMLGEAQLAEDVTQDVFLKCWSRARSFLAARGAFAPWLLTIARHAALDRLRLEKHGLASSNEMDPEKVWELLPAAGGSFEEERWRALFFALQALPQEQRIVIEMAYYQGMSHSEIAAVLGWPVGTVKTRMRLGMDQLRKEWLKEDIPGDLP
jgi:RNA polymerase sigma-70 factor (ECF subfamily)